MSSKRTSDDYHAIAIESGIRWLGPLPRNVHGLSNWSCDCGVQITRSYKQLQHMLSHTNRKTARCVDCNRQEKIERRRHPDSRYKTLARQFNLRWLGPRTDNVEQPTHWQCKVCGHKFARSYVHLSHGHGCPKCRRKRYTVQEHEYVAAARERSLKYLGPFPRNTRVKTSWECNKEGHRFDRSYTDIKRVRGCPLCAPNRRLTLAVCEQLGSQKGLKFIGPLRDGKSKTRWLCLERNAIVRRSYDSVTAGDFCCNVCGKRRRADKKRIKPEEYIALADKHNLECLNPDIGIARTPIEWLYPCGHIRLASFISVRDTPDCPTCNKRAQKTIEDYLSLGQLSGLDFIGKKLPKNRHDKVPWRCNIHGRIFRSYRDVLNSHQAGFSGCNKCGYKARLNHKRLTRVAYETPPLGFRWLGTDIPPNTTFRTFWECSQANHKFKRSLRQLLSYPFCPKCNPVMVNGVRTSVPQNELAKMLGINPRNPRRINVSVRDGNKVRNVDIVKYFSGTKTAVEYDGWTFHGNHMKADSERDEFLVECGFKVLVIKAGSMVPQKIDLYNALNKLASRNTMIIHLVLADWGRGTVFPFK